MFSTLYIDGDHVTPSDDGPATIRLEFDADLCGSTLRCRECQDELIEVADGYVTPCGESTCTEADAEAHDPERIPLSWCNSAAIHTDETDDAVTVTISVGDPRGAFTFTIRRVPDDVGGDLAGQLIMHVPYPGESTPHVELAPMHPGTYYVGSDVALTADR